MVFSKCALTVNRAGLELQPHGTPAFPCAGYDIPCTNCIEDEIVWHYHPELECILVAQGQLCIQVPGRSILVSAGEAVWINAGILHQAVAVPNCVLHSIVYSPSLLCGAENTVFSQTYILPLTRFSRLDACRLTPSCAWGQQALTYFSAAFEALSQESFGYEFTVRSALSQLCLVLCRENWSNLSQQEQILPSDTLRLQKMLDYLHENYTRPLALADIAQAGGVGSRECLRCFRRVVRTTPIQYLLKYRIMQSAALLLTEPETSVSEIALRCGFDSPSHYAQLFHRYFQCTPRAYRMAQNPA